MGAESIFKMLVGGAWRRRALLLTPFVLLSLLGFPVAMMSPSVYAAKTMLLLQEDGRGDPLREAQGAIWDLQNRVRALEVLAKSDRTLKATIAEIGAGGGAESSAVAQQVRDLRERLQVNLVGGQFIEISLRGGEPEQLRDHLNILVSKLLEAMLLPTEDGLDAFSFLVDLRRQQLTALEDTLQAAKLAAGDLSARSLERKEAQREAAAAELATAQTELGELKVALDAARRALEPSDLKELELGLDEALAGRRARLGELERAADTDPAALTQARAALEALERLGVIHGAVEAQKQTVVAKAETASAASETVAAHLKSMRNVTAIREKTEDMRRRLTDYQQRFPIRTPRALHLLGSPEQVKVVDPAQVPQRRLNSRLKIVIAFVAAGVALGVGLAMAAELLDDSLRGPKEAEALLGVPAIARLPRLSAPELGRLRRPPDDAAAMEA